MAANAWVVYDKAKERILAGEAIALRANALRCELLTTDYTPSTTGHEFKSDVAGNITSSAQYPSGGVLSSGVTVTRSNGTITFDANDFDFSPTSSVTISAKYAVMYDDTTTSECLICYSALSSANGGAVASSNGTFQIQIHANGIFTLA
jgi:hypothetical protein